MWGVVGHLWIHPPCCPAGAEVREVDLEAVTGGIVHTKLWVVDQKHLYLGSANMDWRSLSQVWQLFVDKTEEKNLILTNPPFSPTFAFIRDHASFLSGGQRRTTPSLSALTVQHVDDVTFSLRREL